MIELIKGARAMLETCTSVKRGDTVVVIADNEGGPMWLGQIITAALDSMGAKTTLIIIPPRQFADREPPAPVAVAMTKADAILGISDKASLGHTDARKEATAAGAKYYGLQQLTIDDIVRSISPSDIRRIEERTEKLAQLLTKADTASITTPSGTRISLSLTGRKAIAIHPKSSVMTLLPDYAEAAISPVEGTAAGVIVVDLAVIGLELFLKEPLRYIVKSGKVVDVLGDARDVGKLKEVCASDENASNIAELGIGTSHLITGGVRGKRRDAARLGTVHIAIGRNNDIGGNTWSAIHVDSLMDRPTIELDGHCVLRENELFL